MHVLYAAKSPDATEYYRCRIPGKYLARCDGVEVRYTYVEKMPKIPGAVGIQQKDIDWADVVIFQRPTNNVAFNAIQQIRAKNPEKPLIGDYDDDYYSVPKWNPGFPHISMNERWWKQIIPLFDGIITSTIPLRDKLSKHNNKRVVCIPNGFDFEEFDDYTPVEGMQFIAPEKNAQQMRAYYDLNLEQFNEIHKDKTVVVWAGSKFHYCDLDWLPDDIEAVMKKTDDIVFLFVGYCQMNVINKSDVNRLFVTKGVAPVQRFYHMLQGIKFDIMLAPLHPCAFNCSKSNLKLMESMALGAYPLCSAWDAYEYDLNPELNGGETDQIHGQLVGYNPGDWANAILETAGKLKDEEYVKQMRMENDAYVRTTHAAELRTDLYMDLFDELIQKKRVA